MNISLYNLNVKQTEILKAIAIVLIALHNFLHWTNDIGENELSLDPNRIFHLFDVIKGDPLMLFNALLSYTGPFFLPIFIFLSGFGLTKKFLKNDTISYRNYIIPRLAKLYGLWIFGIIICYILFHKYTPGGNGWYFFFSLKSLLLYNNLSVWRIFTSIFGPWWYFALAVQLYLLFPLIYSALKKYKEKGFVIFIAFSYLLIYALTPIANKYEYPIFGNFLGHLPEFVLGMGFAMFKQFRISWRVILLSLVLFIASNFYQAFFPFHYLSIVILLLTVLYPVYNSLREGGIVYRALVFIGSISMFMYIINGPLRIYYIHYFQQGTPLFIMLGSFLHLVLVIILAYLMYVLYKPVNHFIVYVVKKLTSK